MEEKKSLRGTVDLFIQRDSSQDAEWTMSIGHIYPALMQKDLLQQNSFKHMELCVELLVQGFEFVVLCLADRR